MQRSTKFWEKNLEQLVIKTISDIWSQSNGLLDSKDVYQRLIDSDVDVPENALTNIFNNLEKDGMIKISIKFHNREAAKKHGAIVINWVSTYFLENSD